jgi:hypothetical protein
MNICFVEDDPEAEKDCPFSSDVFNRSRSKDSANLSKVLPVKLVGLHFCYDDIRFRMNVPRKGDATRSLDHEGSHVGCRYGLMAYGVFQ